MYWDLRAWSVRDPHFGMNSETIPALSASRGLWLDFRPFHVTMLYTAHRSEKIFDPKPRMSETGNRLSHTNLNYAENVQF
jgi:hypothetical protein